VENIYITLWLIYFGHDLPFFRIVFIFPFLTAAVRAVNLVRPVPLFFVSLLCCIVCQCGTNKDREIENILAYFLCKKHDHSTAVRQNVNIYVQLTLEQSMAK